MAPIGPTDPAGPVGPIVPTGSESTATAKGALAPVIKLWVGLVPSRFARPIVPVPPLAQ